MDRIKNTKISKILEILIYVYIIIQPILEFRWFHNGTIPKVIGFEVATLIRVIFFGVILICFLLSYKIEKKYLKFGLIYGFLIFIYLIAHHLSARKLYTLFPNNFNYSLKGELFYILRMLMPFVLMFILFYIKINKKVFDKVITISTLFIAISIIATSILKIGYITYGDLKVESSIFDWFLNRKKIDPYMASCKGFFMMGIISIQMILCLPYLIYLYFKNGKILNAIYSFLVGISLILIATYTSTFSAIIIFICSILAYIIHLFKCKYLNKEETEKEINKEIRKDFTKKILTMSVLAVILIVIALFSPTFSKKNADIEIRKKIHKGKISKVDPELEKKLPNLSKEEQIKFFEQNIDNLGFNKKFIVERFSYIYDTEFWVRKLKEVPYQNRYNNRMFQKAMLDRVFEVNNSKRDKLFGMGFSRTSNIFTLERDFLYQYYSMGIIGAILLVFPYVAILCYCVIVSLKNFKIKFNLKNMLLFLAMGMALIGAIYSGNTIENLCLTTFFAIIYAQALKEISLKE